MSSVEQLGTDRWRARWRDPDGWQKARTFKQKDFADHYLRNIDAAIQTRTYVDPSLGYVKVKDFAAQWMSAQGHLKPSTRATYESILSHQEVNALAQASGDYRVAVLLLSYCGLRWGELAALKVSQVDLPRHRLSVAEAVSEVHGKLIWGTPKSHQARSVPIPGFLVRSYGRFEG